jgi:hypothetical protein
MPVAVPGLARITKPTAAGVGSRTLRFEFAALSHPLNRRASRW